MDTSGHWMFNSLLMFGNFIHNHWKIIFANSHNKSWITETTVKDDMTEKFCSTPKLTNFIYNPEQSSFRDTSEPLIF